MAQKVALVIGVGPGLGAAVARRFAKGGFDVGVLARKIDNLTPVVKDIEALGQKGLAVTSDVSKFDELKSAVGEVQEKLGSIDVLVYNASGGFGHGGLGPALDIDADLLLNGLKITAVSALVASQLVIPDMLKKGGGSILFTGATAALRGGKNFATFAMGKFALRALSQSLAREFHPQGIHVAHIIMDGQIGTPKQLANTDRSVEAFLNTDDLANEYYHLHTQSKSTWTQELDLRPHLEKF